MADGTKIEWSDATLFGEALPRRCSGCGVVRPVAAFKVDRSRADGHAYLCGTCRRVSPVEVPNRVERAAARRRGEAWCRACGAWHPLASMTKQGLCRAHQRAADRLLYATDPQYRHARRQHAHARHRGVEPLPLMGAENLLEEFEGRCAYCPEPATTWDHIEPVCRGGHTRPGNVVPCCRGCNSSKKDREVFGWLEKTGRQPHPRLYEVICLEAM